MEIKFKMWLTNYRSKTFSYRDTNKNVFTILRSIHCGTDCGSENLKYISNEN